MNNPSAIFDCLFIGSQIQDKFQDFSLSEIQFVAYLSCLLSLYDGKTANSWEYQFIKSDLGSPYSLDLHEALDTLKTNGFFKRQEGDQDFYQLTEKGVKYLEFYKKLKGFQERTKYLEAACNSFDLLPLSLIKVALRNDPVLSSANNSLDKRILLRENNPATNVLHSNFRNLRIALKDHGFKNLITPAMVWIQSLHQLENTTYA